MAAWKKVIFFHFVFTEDFFVDFKKEKEVILLLKGSFAYLFLCLVPIPSTYFENSVFWKLSPPVQI